MNPLEKHFLIQQQRMSRRHGRRFSGQQAVARSFSPIVPDTLRNEHRLAEYETKREAIEQDQEVAA